MGLPGSLRPGDLRDSLRGDGQLRELLGDSLRPGDDLLRAPPDPLRPSDLCRPWGTIRSTCAMDCRCTSRR